MEEQQQQDFDASGTGLRDPERFYCPHAGCNRSFAELWRLKVHYRAPPDVRGSGKERGHGTELAFCPKCGKDLKPGKHHVGCSASKSVVRQPKRRQDEAGLDSEGPLLKALQPSLDHQSAQQGMEAFQLGVPGALTASTSGQPSYYVCVPGPNGVPLWQVIAPGAMGFQQAPPPFPSPPGGFPPLSLGPHQHRSAPASMPSLLGNNMAQQQPLSVEPTKPVHGHELLGGIFADDDHEHDLDLTRIPSPPPLPPDFPDSSHQQQHHGMLFNFGQFSQRMPSSQPLLHGSNQLVKDLTQEALDLAEANVVYESQDDGDLMQLLFGIADEAPTMATIHLHKFPSRHMAPGGTLDEELGMLTAQEQHLADFSLAHREGHAETSLHIKQEQGQAAQQQGQGQAAQHLRRQNSYHRRASGILGTPAAAGTGTGSSQGQGQGLEPAGIKHEDASLQPSRQSTMTGNGQLFSLSTHDDLLNASLEASLGPSLVKADAADPHLSEMHMVRGLFSDSPCPSPHNEAAGLFS